MKTKNILLLIVGFILSISCLNAEYRIYNNQADFEEAKGAVCEAATDGCNNYFLKNGKISGGTRMFCSNHSPEWLCTKYKDNVMTTKMTTETTTENVSFCTMEYAPVCGVNGQTYGNRCGAEKGAKVEVLHEGECSVKNKLGTNDQNFYETIKNKLETKKQNIVTKAIYKYEQKITDYSDSKKQELSEAVIKKIEKVISDLLMKYPQDIALPNDVNEKYLTFTLLKFELMRLK